jgi:uncharacterized protein DUF2848
VTTLDLTLDGEPAATEIRTAIIAGWAGRDAAAVERHIVELEELGVPRPSTTPLFYRVSAARVTTDPEIESTPAASGEVEAVLLRRAGRLWVGVGSDHTDREVEAYGVAVSKELCMKPIAAELWPYEEVEDHWDRLVLRSWIREGGAEVPYQEGSLASLLSAAELMAKAEPSLVDGSIMFCGTFEARGGIRPSDSFRFELEDPVRGRSIGAAYSVSSLPLVR